MSPTNISNRNSSNFYNLAIFICNLFIDGNFQVVHLILDPTENGVHPTFIDNHPDCMIPLAATELNRMSFWDSSPDYTLRNDHILQLIIIDTDRLDEKMNILDDYQAYHRIYIVSSFSQVIAVSLELLNSTVSTAILFGNPLNDEIRIYRPQQKFLDPIYIRSSSSFSPQNLYNVIFEMNELERPLHVHELSRTWSTEQVTYDYEFAYDFVTNLHLIQMNISFIRMSRYRDRIHQNDSYHIIRTYEPIYKELTVITERVNYDHLVLDAPNLIELHINPLLLKNRENHWHFLALDPYESMDVKVMYVYGKNLKRLTRLGWNQIKHAYFNGIFIVLGIIALYLIRRKVNKNRGSWSIIVLDMISLFSGHADIRYRHKLERIFIVIMFFQFFFIQSLNMGNIIASLSTSPEHIDKFWKLSALRPTVCLSNLFGENANLIEKSIR